jgi:hypothetical protein
MPKRISQGHFVISTQAFFLPRGSRTTSRDVRSRVLIKGILNEEVKPR